MFSIRYSDKLLIILIPLINHLDINLFPIFKAIFLIILLLEFVENYCFKCNSNEEIAFRKKNFKCVLIKAEPFKFYRKERSRLDKCYNK
jgi:hypothetical protein